MPRCELEAPESVPKYLNEFRHHAELIACEVEGLELGIQRLQPDGALALGRFIPCALSRVPLYGVAGGEVGLGLLCATDLRR